ncbi:DNA-binding transcriptional regulator, LysR family [Jatrophihabitans endophyticus]|uniref:DNA-binding transcriptional regulator, LysR family n=1 Tax=Jatrophihabitans endophyticus TaxID=1206085 RepID=A0A1M5SZM1_9ACTN|nr:LysR family transcriptional regulator [Jatrophihabitans endophyticus]SHH43926.1 DNA-binding transcriptional regulator, LysR family [Jatrophihabitans endophyticus]
MDPNPLELRHLRALVAVTEEGTFTAAAARLGISQPALSRTVVALEALLEGQLVTRTTRSVALTDVGVRTYRAAVAALAAVDDVAAAAGRQPRPLRLGYAWSALGRHTGEVMRRWRSDYPQVPLEVHRVDHADGGLDRGIADVAVVRGEFERSDRVTQLLFREPRMAVLPVGHRLAAQESILLGELRDETVVITHYGITRLDLWPPSERPRVALTVDNTDDWLTEIAGGLGIGVTGESTASQHAHPGVTFVPIDDAERLAVHLAWPVRPTHPATAEFAELVTRVVTSR